MTRAKKHLGQHFLKSKATLEKMVAVAGVQQGERVLEIGPGEGVLTSALLSAGAQVTAVEIDADMIALLEEKFADALASGQLQIIQDDILKCTRGALVHLENYKLVANIPYYITGEIVRKFLTMERQPESMTLLVQKEVAERIVAKDGKESMLSISVKAYGTPHYALTVPARYFSPAPKVDSAVLHIADISKRFFAEVSEDRFFKIMRAGFASKRKVLANNLSAFGGKEKVVATLVSLGLRPDARAETLPASQWRELAQALDPAYNFA